MKARMVTPVLIGTGTLLLVVIAIVRSGFLAPPDDQQERTQSLINEGQRRYSSIKLVSLDTLADPKAIGGVLSQANAEPQPQKPELLEVLEATAEFLHYRFNQQSPSAYVQWRRDRGDRLKPADELRTTWLIDSDYEALFEGPYPGDAELERVFERFWTFGITAIPGSAVVAIAAEPPGVCVRIDELKRQDPLPLLECELTSELWHGYVVSTKRNWWEATRSLEAARSSQQSLLVAVVGIVCEVDNGSVLPWHFVWYRDRTGSPWALHSVTTGNSRDPGSSLEF